MSGCTDEVHHYGINSSNFQQETENDSIAAKVIDLTKKYGIEQKHVQSDYIRTYPSYQYERYNETSKIAYYVVQKRIVIKLKEISKFEQLLSDITGTGGAMIQGIEFLSTEISNTGTRQKTGSAGGKR